MRKTARFKLLLVPIALWACEFEDRSQGSLCGAGEVRSGHECISNEMTIQANSNARMDNSRRDSDDLDVPAAPTEFPIAVDDWFYPSGYMGDGEAGGIATASCTGQPIDIAGFCHAFIWTPGTVGWAGVFWQFPDMNWGTEAGLVMPEGAQSVRFLAWGDSGTEAATFGVGMGDVDGFSVETDVIELTSEPTEYVVDLRGVSYSEVVGGFMWSMSGAETPQTVYVADVHWSDIAIDGEPARSSSEIVELPLVVDDWFVASGYMGDGETGGISTVACTGEREGTVGQCHGFAWTPGNAGWAGVYWQHPDMNWGVEPGLSMPDGAQSVRFLAWGGAGDEIVTFGVGMADVDGFSVDTGAIVLTSEPVEYVIDLRGQSYGAVVGGFTWSMAGADEETTIFIDDIHWSQVADDSVPPPPSAATEPSLPLSVDDWFFANGFMGDGESGGITTTPCENRPPDALGSCHGFQWTPGDFGWAGVYWQYPDMNWGEASGLGLPEGAQSVRFMAWGAQGGENATFGVGMSSVDGFSADTGQLTLTTIPTEYLVDMRGVSYQNVVGGFTWSMSGATEPVTIYVDDIHWSEIPDESMPPPASAPTEPTLPLTVDDWFYPSGYMGDGASGGITQVPCGDRSMAYVGDCHGFLWTPGRLGWAGVYWQHPDMNWGAEDGLVIPMGALSVRFTAWGSAGGEVVSFGVGMDDVDGFAEDTGPITLTTDPAEYVINLADVTYSLVVGGFTWSMSDADEPQTIFIDNIHWSEVPDTSAPIERPMPGMSELPLAVDDWFYASGFMGDGENGGVVDSPCDVREPRALGDCHHFTWTPGQIGWAGLIWQYPQGNWGTDDGLAMPQDAKSIRFTAWGATGGEVVEFSVGMEGEDGFGVSRTLRLTSEATEYVLDLRDIEYNLVVGGFAWTASDASGNLSFYLDNLRWSTVPPTDEELASQELFPPFYVNEYFSRSGRRGNGPAIRDEPCPDTVELEHCRLFTWTPSFFGVQWGGLTWEYPSHNGGTEPGAAIAQGATTVQFVAWSDMPGTVIDVSAGYGISSPDGFVINREGLQLTAEPTEYEIDLTGTAYQRVGSAFSWQISSTEMKQFYIAKVRWLP